MLLKINLGQRGIDRILLMIFKEMHVVFSGLEKMIDVSPVVSYVPLERLVHPRFSFSHVNVPAAEPDRKPCVQRCTA